MGVSHLTRYVKNIAIAVILALVLTTCCSPIIVIKGSSVAEKNHPQPGIWDYKNSINIPDSALVLSVERELWQVKSAACITPAFIGRTHNIPLLFDDGSEERGVLIPHETKEITEFGNDVRSASAGIASTYWSKAEVVIAAITYEEVLWAVPMASFLSAPVLVSPSSATLQSLGTKCVIAIGETEAAAEEIIHLPTKSDVWQFQLELFDTKGRECNYIVTTNPYDTREDSNIKWRFLSLASAPLAAHRGAIVQTANYTGNRAAIDSIARANKNLDETYQSIKPSFEKVKNDTYHAAQFLAENGHIPEFLALVGGSYALPDYFFDYHVSYFYWGASLDYVASTAPYGNLTYNLSYETYPREDMGVGRIMGHSLLDCSIILMRTFSYHEFLPGGKYTELAPSSWENMSSVIEGHRVNQPNFGGPPVPNTIPYKPAGEVDDIFTQAGFNETYLVPRNITLKDDMNMPTGEILDNASSSSILLINAHGGVSGEQALIEIGIDPVLEKEYTYILDETEAMKRDYPPSLIYVIACETGTTAIDLPNEDYLSLGFLHSGTVSYIAPDTYQTICFWDKAPDGPEADQTTFFFSRLLSENIPVGTALSEAKWEAYQLWRNESTQADDVAGTTMHLYGDPAFEPYKPQVAFEESNSFDVTVYFDRIASADSKFDVHVSLRDLHSKNDINDAQVRIAFQKKAANKNSAEFEVPDQKGTYNLDIIIGKEGYEGLRVRYRVHVPTSRGDVTPFILSGIIMAIVITIVLIYAKKRQPPKTFVVDSTSNIKSEMDSPQQSDDFNGNENVGG